MSDRVTVAERAAKAGGSVALESFRSDLRIEEKSEKTDVVTQADRDAQVCVADAVDDAYPDDAFVGEEGDALKTVPPSGSAWIVDPIDGTANFVRGRRDWGTAVAAAVDAEPVAAAIEFPALGDTYVADESETRLNGERVSVSRRTDPERCTVVPTAWWDFDHRDEFAAAARAVVERFGDMRRLGCAQATLSGVADGSFDGALTNVETHPWDTVAGVHAIRRAGGRVTDLEGDPWRHDSKGLVASNGRIHDELLAAARSIERAD